MPEGGEIQEVIAEKPRRAKGIDLPADTPRSTPKPAAAPVQTSPIAPPMPKHSAFSRNGGTGAEPMVNSASSDHIRIAVKPMAWRASGHRGPPGGPRLLPETRRSSSHCGLSSPTRRCAPECKRPASQRTGRSAAACGQTKNWPPLRRNRRAGDEPGVIRGQEHHERAISSGSPRRPTGICGMMRSFSTFSSIAAHHFGADIARADRVHGDPGPRAFLRQRLGEAQIARLAAE